MPGFCLCWSCQPHDPQFRQRLADAMGRMVHGPDYSADTILALPSLLVGASCYPGYPTHTWTALIRPR